MRSSTHSPGEKESGGKGRERVRDSREGEEKDCFPVCQVFLIFHVN